MALALGVFAEVVALGGFYQIEFFFRLQTGNFDGKEENSVFSAAVCAAETLAVGQFQVVLIAGNQAAGEVKLAFVKGGVPGAGEGIWGLGGKKKEENQGKNPQTQNQNKTAALHDDPPFQLIGVIIHQRGAKSQCLKANIYVNLFDKNLVKQTRGFSLSGKRCWEKPAKQGENGGVCWMQTGGWVDAKEKKAATGAVMAGV